MADKRPRIQNIRCDAFNDDPLRVARVAAKIPTKSDIARAAAGLSATAHQTRLTVLFALEQEPLCVCELSSLLATSPPAVMHHIQNLAGEGMIDVEKRGKFAEYFLTDHGAEALTWARELLANRASA